MQNFKTHRIQVQAEIFQGHARRSWAPLRPGGWQIPRKAPGKMDLKQHPNPEVFISAVALSVCGHEIRSSHPFTHRSQGMGEHPPLKVTLLQEGPHQWHWLLTDNGAAFQLILTKIPRNCQPRGLVRPNY